MYSDETDHPEQKGITVRHLETTCRTPEHAGNAPCADPGLSAILRAVSRGDGSAASRRRLPRRLLVVRAAVLTALLVFVMTATSTAVASTPARPALVLTGAIGSVTPATAKPPQIETELVPGSEHIYSTRASLLARAATEGLPSKWHSEYSTDDQWPGTPAASGEEPALNGSGETDMYIGTLDLTSAGGFETSVLHHLAPETTYYVRFVIEDEAGPATATFKFTTLPVAKPEIASIPSEDLPNTTFSITSIAPTSAAFVAEVESNGAPTSYSFEYAEAPGGPWSLLTTGGAGVVSDAEDFAEPEAKLTGLKPETTYYMRLKASNAKGPTEQAKFNGPVTSSSGAPVREETSSFTTASARPELGATRVRNVLGTSAHLTGSVLPKGSETFWRFEYSTSATGGWSPVAGAEGTISLAEAQALSEGVSPPGIEGDLEGLSPAKTYYVRLFAENKCEVGCGGIPGEVASFKTSGPPAAATFAVHALHGESVRLLGSVNPSSVPTSAEQRISVEDAPAGASFTLTFEGQTTAPIVLGASANGAGGVQEALNSLSSVPAGALLVEGRDGGPYTVFFGGGGFAGKAVPAIEAAVTPSGKASVVTVQEGGVGYDTHYHFQYVAQAQFAKPGAEGGFAGAAATPAVDAGLGESPVVVGQDLPALQGGEVYRYRLQATNTSPGDPVVDGEEHQLTAPGSASPLAPAACANASLRTGASAVLPDCRAYEQLTPVDKEGNQEPFVYTFGVQGTFGAGEDGEHFALNNPTISYGSGPGAGQGPYFFSRTPSGWQMTAASPQPQTGVERVVPQVFSPDLTQFAFAADVHTSRGDGESKDVEFKAGPAGGPYTAISIPRREVENATTDGGWVAASADFSKLVLTTEDRTLAGRSTGTASGYDLYEYAAGQTRQVNVGAGRCGAHIVRGQEGRPGNVSSSHAISVEGSRVFFEAAPGSA